MGSGQDSQRVSELFLFLLEGKDAVREGGESENLWEFSLGMGGGISMNMQKMLRIAC